MSSSGYIFNIMKYAVHDGPGIRTTVFFQGCPLRCSWCHNPESQSLIEGDFNSGPVNCLKPFYRQISYQKARRISVQELMAELRKDLVFFEESGGGVTVSGGEPLLQSGFLQDLLTACREDSIHVAVDTSGYAPWQSFKIINPLVNLFLFDLKLLNDDAHRHYTGVSNRPILTNLEKLIRIKHPLIVRVPLIPGVTDTRNNLIEIAEFMGRFQPVPEIQLLPYNPMGGKKYKKLKKTDKFKSIRTQAPEQLDTILDLFGQYDMQATIGG